MVMAIPQSSPAIQVWVTEEFKYTCICIDVGQKQQRGRGGGHYDVV